MPILCNLLTTYKICKKIFLLFYDKASEEHAKLKYGLSRCFSPSSSCGERSRTADNFPATYFIILKAGLRFVTSLRSDKTGTSFSLAANSCSFKN